MIDIEVEDSAWTDALADAEALVLAAAEATLASEGAVGEGVSFLLTDDKSIRDLNRRFRGQDKPTNVLSFPAPQNPERFLGDVALAHGVCAREAAEQGKPLKNHLQHLVAHGVFHLLGYDHETDAQADEMEGLERAVLADLGIPDPYAAGPKSSG
ncbi:MAG: rRNA maturation RNase YbeY [Phenylobacterium sp.]